MNYKGIVLLLLVVVGISAVIMARVLIKAPTQDFDVVAVNDIVETISKHWRNIERGDFSSFNSISQEYKLQFSVINKDAEVIFATSDNVSLNLNEGIRHRDIMVDVAVNGEIVGKIIFYNNFSDLLKQQRHELLGVVVVLLIFVVGLCLGYIFYLNRVIFKPFNRLQALAKHVANGNLDFRLEMDEHNIFGSFTESFDIMRDELKKAQENERLANKSKKELVACLNHDIKKPIASIKAVSEILLIKSNDELAKRQLEIIGAKADQIDLLISNMPALLQLQDFLI